MWKPILFLSLAIAFAFLGCEAEEEPELASPTIPPTQEITDAVAAYVGSTGLDGDTLGLTDPLECDAIAAQVDAAASEQEAGEIIQGTAGKLCFGPVDIGGTTATVQVGIYATEASWELTLTLEDGEWAVTDVEYIGL